MAILKLAGGLTACGVAVAGCSATTTTTTGATTTTGPTTWATIAIPTTGNVQVWAKTNADTFFRIGHQMSDMAQAEKAGDYNAMHDDCTRVSSGIHDLRHAMPTPDAGLTAALEEAMDSLTVAMSQCEAIGPDSSVQDIDQNTTQLRVATGQLNVAADILERTLGESH
jgi:hypothetical protein